MEKKDFRILFLDDEVYKHDGNPAEIAHEAIKEAGYNIEVVDKMSDVIDAYYKNYYHLYILDIDMSKVSDNFEGNGATVGEVLRRLSSISKVVVYSGAGRVNDWVKSANFHFYYYVQKEESDSKLLSIIDEVFQSTTTQSIKIPSFESIEHDNKILVYYAECQIEKEYLNSHLESPQYFDSLDTLKTALDSSKPKLIVIMMQEVVKTFKGPDIISTINQLTAYQPVPNVIFCLDASQEKPTILDVVNARPFRIVNIESSNFEKEFQEAVDKALFWFGENEIFDLPENNQLVRKELFDIELPEYNDMTWEEYTEDLSDTESEDGNDR
ncbi:MAG TPA: response regulator [Candidatus Cloacimonadota bacterium]|nr:response regulator [Candidatus Cloacimonadota bacterium]